MINTGLTEQEKESLLKWFLTNGYFKVDDDLKTYHWICYQHGDLKLFKNSPGGDDEIIELIKNAMNGLQCSVLGIDLNIKK